MWVWWFDVTIWHPDVKPRSLSWKGYKYRWYVNVLVLYYNPGHPFSNILTLTGCVLTMRRISGSANTALRCTTCIHVVYMLYSKWAGNIGNAIDWASAIHHLMVVWHVGRLYTSLRRWKFWTIVWENTNGVHFCAVWKNTAHVQGIRCSPKGSHLIPWTSAVFSNTALKCTRLHIIHLGIQPLLLDK